MKIDDHWQKSICTVIKSLLLQAQLIKTPLQTLAEAVPSG